VNGGKTQEEIQALDDTLKVQEGHIRAFFRPEDAEAFLRRDLDWLEAALLGGKATDSMRRAILMARVNPTALMRGKQAARVWLGTIHSVKGGQADTVMVFPSYTAAAARYELEMPGTLDRIFYVGVTRARQKLVLLGPGAAPHAYRWPEVSEEVVV